MPIVPPRLPFEFTAPLVTERLTLRLFAPGDADDVYAYNSLPEVAKYELNDPRTYDETVAKIDLWSQAAILGGDGDYWQLATVLTDLDGTSRVIGDTYFKIASLKNSRGEIGWTMNPEYQGHGYASEAAAAVMELAFRAIGLHRVVAELDPENAKSVALCKRLGMREEALFVKDLVVKGEWGDSGMYGILETEWFAAHPA